MILLLYVFIFSINISSTRINLGAWISNRVLHHRRPPLLRKRIHKGHYRHWQLFPMFYWLPPFLFSFFRLHETDSPNHCMKLGRLNWIFGYKTKITVDWFNDSATSRVQQVMKLWCIAKYVRLNYGVCLRWKMSWER